MCSIDACNCSGISNSKLPMATDIDNSHIECVVFRTHFICFFFQLREENDELRRQLQEAQELARRQSDR